MFDHVCPLQLAHSTATRGAFLIQATTMLTPLISLAAGERLSRAIWSACGLALAGTALITADSAGAGSTGAAGGVTLGKLAVSPSLLLLLSCNLLWLHNLAAALSALVGTCSSAQA